MVCFQILVSFTSLTETTTGFLYDTKCAAPPPCTCYSNTIQCDNKNLSQVPVFTKHNEQYYSINPITLRLDSNQLTTIPAYAFKNLPPINVTRIWLNNNHISSIETLAFSGVENSVSGLFLSSNNLTHLPLALTELSSLHELHLYGNSLVKLDASVLANISSSLNNLRISVDRFTRFPN